MRDKTHGTARKTKTAVRTTRPAVRPARFVEARRASLGDAVLTLVVESSAIDKAVARLTRAIAAFKREWEKTEG